MSKARLREGGWKIGSDTVDATAAEIDAAAGTGISQAELAVLNAVVPGTAAASKAVVLDASKDIATLGAVTVTNLVIAGSVGMDHAINMDSITAVTAAETSAFGNIIKASRSAGAIGGTHAGAIIKHYITGGAVDGTGVVAGAYVFFKYAPDTVNAAAESALLVLTRHSSSDKTLDYGIYTLAAASKVTALLGVSGTMTNFLEVKADGDAGFTVGNDGMTANPESGTEDAWFTMKIENGQSYQWPCYEA